MKFFFYFFILQATSPVLALVCNGIYCGQSSCESCSANVCSASTCSLAGNCFCPSTNIPGNISLAETPQFILLNFLGPLKDSEYTALEFYKNFVYELEDSTGCKSRPSFFIATEGTDYNYVKFAKEVIGDVALYSHTLSADVNSTAVHWNSEYKYPEFLTDQLANISNKTINTARACNFQFATDYFDTIYSMKNITIDSSIPHIKSPADGKRYWPYTLDYGLPEKGFCSEAYGNCPKKVYPGLWEVPVTQYYSLNNSLSHVITPNASNLTILYESYKKNFDDNYKSNRAPFGIYFSWDWFFDKGKVNTNKINFLKIFIEYIVINYQNIVFASESQLIDWVKSPENYSTYKLKHQSTCMRGATTLSPKTFCSLTTLCKYPTGKNDFYICGKDCPTSYPSIRQFTCGDGVCQSGFEDCTCVDCASCRANWPGFVKFNVTEDTGYQVCGNLFFKNLYPYGTNAFVISMEFCTSANISRYWGGKVAGIITKPNDTEILLNPYAPPPESHLWRLMLSYFNAKYWQDYTFTGVCFNYDGRFQPKYMLRFGMDMISSLPNCTAGSCPVVCGNKICELGEHKYNCPIDCDPVNCSITKINYQPYILKETAKKSKTLSCLSLLIVFFSILVIFHR